jgi:mannose-6-phosphate isomerase-like protein (cupin superfamily)
MERLPLQMPICWVLDESMSKTSEIRAEVVLTTTDLRADLGFFGPVLGLRLDAIFPADDPAVAVFSGHGLRIRLDQGAGGPAGLLRILTDDPAFAGGQTALTAPGGTRVEVSPLSTPLEMPPTEHAFVVRRLADGAPWVIGRAGMLYRDLVPSHRVLEASDGIEVIEIGVPAQHVTEIDHVMTLPTPHLRPEREWQGQRFVFNRAEGAVWQPFRLTGYVARDTTIAANTQGVADVKVVRKGQGVPFWASHDANILFGFVMEGAMTLEAEGQPSRHLTPGDAFVIPPGMSTRWADPSADVEVLEVALPGVFATA